MTTSQRGPRASRLITIILTSFLLIGKAFAGDTYNPFTGQLDYCSTIQEADGSPSNKSCKPVYVTNGSLTDNGSYYSLSTGGTSYAAGGSLLQLIGNTFSVKEGTLINLKGCTYSTVSGIVCNSDFLTSYAETDPIVKAINGIVKSNGSTISAAVAGTDYVLPSAQAWQDGGTNVYLTTTTDKVGIGTTTPATTLEIVKQSTSAPLYVSSSASGAGDYLTINSAGNTLIGTSGSAKSIFVQGTGKVNIGTVNNTVPLEIATTGNVVANLGGQASGTAATNTVGPVISNSDSTEGNQAGIRMGSTYGGSAVGSVSTKFDRANGRGDLIFGAGTGSPTERMRVKYDGNVGIGTTTPVGGLAVMNGNVGVGTWSPTNKLQVIGNIQATSFVKSGGVSSDFLKADGSSDSTVYGTGTLTGTGTDYSLARWVSGALIDSSVYSDGSNAWAGDGFSVNANVFNNGIFEVMSGSSGGARSFYVGTNNDIVTTRYNTLDTGDGSVSMGGSSGNIFTVGTTTDYGLGVQVAQNGPALFRIKQSDATLHDGIWSFDAEGNNLYWGTSNQNYAQIKRDNGLGGVYEFDIMWGIIDSYQTMAVLPSSVGIKTGASTPPSMLSLAGNMSIGATYGTTNAAPTDGLIVQGNVGIGTVIPGQKLEVVGTIKTSQLIDTGATASTYAYFNASKQISSATLGTGLANSSGTLNSNAVSFVTYQPGLLTAVNATIGVNYKFSKASTVDNLIGSAVTFSCIANPTVTMYECGTSTTCATPTTIGTVTVTAAGTLVSGTVSNSAITAGDYIGWAITAGTCASIDIAATAQVHSN